MIICVYVCVNWCFCKCHLNQLNFLELGLCFLCVGTTEAEKWQCFCNPLDKIMEEELADYNGDDDNEGEFEADKQAELAQD